MISSKTNTKVILAAMRSAKIKQKKLAKIIGVNPVCIHEVIYGKRKNPRIRAIIAMAIGKQVSDLWPENKNASTPDSGKKTTAGDVGRASDPIRG